MTNLLRKPSLQSTHRHAITPQNAPWKYIGFDLHQLPPNRRVTGKEADRETLLVWVAGKGSLIVDGQDHGEVGKRTSVFADKPYSAYIPRDTFWQVDATTNLELAVCTAPSNAKDSDLHPFRIIRPTDVAQEARGRDQNTRYVHPILMEDKPWAEHLLVTEVITPSSHWSSYPSHRHDEDDFPRITMLEEVYYHRFSAPTGFGYQRIYTDRDELGHRRIDNAYTIEDGDVVLVPYGYHPCGAAYGYDLYYLNVMAGPRRQWRFTNDPDHDWIAQRDAKPSTN